MNLSDYFKVYEIKLLERLLLSHSHKVRIISDIQIKNLLLAILHQDQGYFPIYFQEYILTLLDDGIYSVKASNHISCQKVHETDIDNVFLS